MRFCREIEPFSLFQWKFQQISPHLHQKHQSLTLTQQIATTGLILQQNIFQGMFFNKNTFPRTPANKEIKGKAQLVQRQLQRHVAKGIWTEISKESEDYSANNLFDRTRAVQFQQLFLQQFLGNTLSLSASSLQPQLTGSLHLPFLRERGCNWEKEEDELNRSTLKVNCSFSGSPNPGRQAACEIKPLHLWERNNWPGEPLAIHFSNTFWIKCLKDSI